MSYSMLTRSKIRPGYDYPLLGSELSLRALRCKGWLHASCDVSCTQSQMMVSMTAWLSCRPADLGRLRSARMRREWVPLKSKHFLRCCTLYHTLQGRPAIVHSNVPSLFHLEALGSLDPLMTRKIHVTGHINNAQ